jgi:hypothetical protein
MKNSKKSSTEQINKYTVTWSWEKKSGGQARRTFKDTLSYNIQLLVELPKNELDHHEFTSNMLEAVGDKITITVRKTDAGKPGGSLVQSNKELVQISKGLEMTSLADTASAACYLGTNTTTVASSDISGTSKKSNSMLPPAEKKRRLSSGSMEVQDPVNPPGSKPCAMVMDTIGPCQSANGSTDTTKKRSLSSMTSDTIQSQPGDQYNGTSAFSTVSHSKSKQKEVIDSSPAKSSLSPQTTHQSSLWDSGPTQGSTNMNEKPSYDESTEQSDSESEDEPSTIKSGPISYSDNEEEILAELKQAVPGFDKMTDDMKESLIANLKEALLEANYSPGMDEVGDESDEDVDMSPLEYDDESADSDF